MDTPAVAKFAARIRMFDRVIVSASLALSNLPDDNNDRYAMLRATIDSMAEETAADPCRSPIRPVSETPAVLGHRMQGRRELRHVLSGGTWLRVYGLGHSFRFAVRINHMSDGPIIA